MDHSYLQEAIRRMEEKTNWGDSNQWPKSLFELLSEQVFQASGILVSGSTLNRLYAKVKAGNQDYNPQLHTKNALAKYIGYQNWADFTQRVPLPVPKVEPKPALVKKKSRLPALLTGGVIFVVCLLLFALTASNKRFAFDGKNLTGKTPLTVGFTYDVSRLPHTQFAVMDEHTKAELNRDNRYLSIVYPIPGFYRVRLLGDGKVLDNENVMALSNGWVPLYLQGPTMHLLPQSALEKGTGRLSVPPAQVLANRIDTVGEYWISYRNVRDFGVSGDDCTFECRLLAGPAIGGRFGPGNDPRIDFIGEKGCGYVGFSSPGFSQFSAIQFAENSYNGVFHQLDSLCRDFSTWRHIRITIKNNRVMLYFENRLIYRMTYDKQQIGRLKGIYLVFKWAGAVDDVKLYDGDHRLVYQDSFDEPVALRH